jgi:hypothetical protein
MRSDLLACSTLTGTLCPSVHGSLSASSRRGVRKRSTAALAQWLVAALLLPGAGGVAGSREAGTGMTERDHLTCVDVFPDGKPQLAIEDKHFPTRLHAFVWRNWESVSPERMAKTVGTTPRKIRQMGLSMGLPESVTPSRDFQTRGYVTIIRHNWHLLPYEQLLTLLDWDSKTLDFHLNEDDFLFIKLGNFKPVCEPLKYVEPDAATRKRCAAIKAVVASHFGDQLNQPGQPRFDFVRTLSQPDKSKPLSALGRDQDGQPRFLYSYFAVYGDPLANANLDPFPDGLLQRLSESGVNGIWLQALLRQISPPTRAFPEFGEGYEERIKNLRKLVSRADRFGIKLYLYISEPRAMPPQFFKEREQLKGVPLRGFYTMCTSTPEVRQWVADSLAFVFREVPGLGGVFTTSKCENPTSCYSDCVANEANTCPRCSRRTGPEVIAEINSTIADGVWRGNPSAKVIIWDWIWPDEWFEPIVSRLPRNAYLMTVSEWDKAISRGGVASKVNEYSLSAVGPSERAEHRWALARKYGLKTSAKMQVNTTWELSTLPYLPVMNLVAQHCDHLTRENVDAFMLSWSLGGCPSPNLKLAKLFSQKPAPTVAEALTSIAAEYYGIAAAPDVLEAWSKFSDVFTEYPFAPTTLYFCPVQLGPANLLYPAPTGYTATMVGYSYDDLKSWVSIYPVDTFASQFEKIAAGWQPGLAAFERAAAKAETGLQPANARTDLRLAEAAYLHFRSVANQVRFTKARNAFRDATPGAQSRQEYIKIMKSAATDEIQLAERLFRLAKQDSRIGFEASNQYHYLPLDLVEKVVNCEYVLKDWLPRFAR